jgi:hypothetical protein
MSQDEARKPNSANENRLSLGGFFVFVAKAWQNLDATANNSK